MRQLSRSRLWSVLFVFALCASTAFGQVADANVVGTVTDQTGAAVPDAEMALENMETAVRYASTTDSQGTYRFPNVPVGRYRLTATKTGFTTQTLQNIALELNRTSTVNVTMAIGAVATTVEVVDAAALIDTTTATVQTTYNTKTAVQMPITNSVLGVINLSLLSAGVTSSGGVGYGTGPSVGGQRPTNNNFMIEGVDNNDRSLTGPVVNVSNEYVAEFSIQQNQFSPEFGHSTGGQFNSVVRSGTNEFHGSIYEYFQNRNLNAVDEQFARQGIRSHPRYDYNRLGGTIGGPVIKNKIFFFGGFEYTPIGQASTSPGAVFGPTAEGIRQLESLPGLSRTNLDYFKQWVPVADSSTRTVAVGGASIPVGPLSVTGPSFQNTYHPSASLDIQASDKDSIRLRWLHTAIDSINTLQVAIPAFYTPIVQRNHIASVAYFRNFTPNLINELRFGWNRKEDNRPVNEEWQFPGLDAQPNIQIADISMQIGPNANYPQGGRYGTYQLADNVSWIVGRHTLKFGYDGRKVNASNFFVQRFRGDYIYQTFDRYLRDITPEFAQRSGGGFPFIGNLLSHYAFVNDEWRIRPNLTLNLGLRYEYVGVPVGTQSQELNALASVPGLITFAAPEPTTKDFAPRVGIAWSPGQSGRTAIRAGFGMAYDQFYQNLGTNALPPQYFTTIDAHIDQPNQPNFLANGGIRARIVEITDPVTARRLTASYIPIEQKRPYSVQWNLGVQQVFREDYTLEVRYLGSRGIHLPFQTQLNRFAGVTANNPGLPMFTQQPSQAELDALAVSLADLTAARPVHPLTAAGFASTITGFTPQGNSWYHGLATQLTRRYSNGLQFTGAYTWSHNIDDSTATLGSTFLTPRRAQDFFDVRAEKADSALDRRHRFSFGWVYETPWFRQGDNWLMKNLIGNWTFSGTYIAETGAWMTARSGVDSNLNGDTAADRAIINPNGTAGVGSAVTPLCRTGTGACSTTAGRARVVGYLVTNPNAEYIQAGEGVFPNGGRNTVRLPGINNFDLSLGKRINVTERMAFEIRGEAYNAFNNSQYVAGFPSVANLRSRATTAVDALAQVNNAVFNRPDLAFQSNARTMQLVGRFTF